MRNPTTSVALCLSIFFSTVLLFTDAELWASAPHHGYALAGFTIVDGFALALLQTRRVNKLYVVWGLAKFMVFLGDILTAPELGITYGEFASYLFSLWAYDALLASQLGIAAGPYVDKLLDRK